MKISISEDPRNPDNLAITAALAFAYRPENPATLTFKVRLDDEGEQKTMRMKITGVEYKHPVPGMFNIRGYVVVEGCDPADASGFYDANRRVGLLETTAAAAKNAG